MKKLFIMIIFSFIFLLTACGEEIETNMSGEVAEFEFTTQDNETLGLADLHGQWWIADFIFTNCTTTCLPMTSNMSDLQSKLNNENLNVQLISFSVDPAFDTPAVLKEYGEDYDADFSNWSFLTGYDFETIKDLSENSFRSVLIPPPDGDDQVTHGTSFFLVNPEGEIIKRYSGINNSEMDLIIDDLKLVLQ